MLIEIATQSAPSVAVAGGKSFLVYELHLTNFVPDRVMTIDAVDVLGDASSTPLASLDKAAVARNFRVIGASASKDEPTQLAAGQRAVLFLWVPLAKQRPASVLNRVRLHIAGVPRSYIMDGPSVAVSIRPPRVIRPPVEGGAWVAANGPAPAQVPPHNQLLYPGRGAIHVPQRFATDWILLDRKGRLFTGPIDQNSSYPGHGVPVLAVANGTIAAVHDGVRENRPPEVTEKLSQADRAGNYVILDIGGGVFAFYGHLVPGSMKVRLGQKVIAGQRLASLGNSGNSTGPHLHFHLTDGPALSSAGIPFVFDSYQDLGELKVSLDELEQGKPAKTGVPVPEARNLPLGGRILQFPK